MYIYISRYKLTYKLYKLVSTNCIVCVCYFMIEDYNYIYRYIHIYIIYLDIDIYNIYIYIYMHIYKNLWPLFVDGVQLPQGLKATTRRQWLYRKDERLR